MKQTQKNKILKLLRENGKVSRNEALRMYISRLGAIVCQLRKEGMDIESKFIEGDYVYFLKDQPKVIPYYVDGQLVAQKKIWKEATNLRNKV